MRLLTHTAWLLLAALPAACSLDVNYDGSQFACRDGVCPTGQECRAGLCELRADAAPPPPADAAIDAPNAPDGGVDASTFCTGADDIFDPTSNHCYSLDRALRTWDAARLACNARGPTAHLVYINSSTENVVVSLLGNGGVGLAWMGATDAQVEDDWHWLDGLTFPPTFQPDIDFDNWNAGEPNNGNGSGEDCGAINLMTGGWDDRSCASTSTRPSVCEIE